MSGEVMSEIIVLTDGQCRFCKASMDWVAKKLEVQAIAYQSTELSQYGLSHEQCAQQVHVVHAGTTYGGAAAIAFLLGRRGNWILGFIVRASGPLGRFGYAWVAGHRNSWLIRTATKLIERSL
jgi:predicted DCC family thiol-disulfide oxidoreductase YuxK